MQPVVISVEITRLARRPVNKQPAVPPSPPRAFNINTLKEGEEPKHFSTQLLRPTTWQNVYNHVHTIGKIKNRKQMLDVHHVGGTLIDHLEAAGMQYNDHDTKAAIETGHKNGTHTKAADGWHTLRESSKTTNKYVNLPTKAMTSDICLEYSVEAKRWTLKIDTQELSTEGFVLNAESNDQLPDTSLWVQNTPSTHAITLKFKGATNGFPPAFCFVIVRRVTSPSPLLLRAQSTIARYTLPSATGPCTGP